MSEDGTPVSRSYDTRSGSGDENQYVLSLDIGTTVLCCHIYDKDANIKGTSRQKVEILHPKTGWMEMDPDRLVEQVISSVKDCVKASGLQLHQLKCMAIATQRGTFITWDRETGKPFHNLITWQDLRSASYVKTWNSSYTMQGLNSVSKLLHLITRKKRFLAASVLRFMAKQVTLRLLWALDNIPQLRIRASEGQVMFGCIDTWLVWKLTGKQVHATDFSCASSTGLFDPFQIEWSSIVCSLINIPMSMFPEVRDTSGYFGDTDADILGAAIPITCVVADQQGAMFGQCCFDIGDVKCTLGTGTFIDLNTGSKPHASVAGLYPLIGWKIGSEMVFIAEGIAADTGFFDDVSETASLAESVPNSGGVYFVPAFSGLQAPINDDGATSSMIGMQPDTTKAHIVRAILESIAFRFKILYETILSETKIPISHMRVDGGVCNNTFLMQLMSDLVNKSLDRSKHTDMTSLGAAFLAGLATGIWKNKEELRRLRTSHCIYSPRPTWNQYKDTFHEWERAVSRSLQWYRTDTPGT
ncbi:putative glycerol kinase 5 isoform X2 [Gigantopelta aegis]|uniref:putative glycerol kinase 5 isoform X2 n=1 Tax=Gigantopelta aegis TaxID=1735272 RepID=UPI001B88E582|nr:putative glycerol kinase 5 isoform X2 [Gigantopelta aegis]